MSAIRSSRTREIASNSAESVSGSSRFWPPEFLSGIVVSGSERFSSPGIFGDLRDQAIKISYGKAYAGALIGLIADSSRRSGAFGKAFGQHQDTLDLVAARKLIAQGSDLANTQQRHFLGTQLQLEADLNDQCILGGVPMMFDLIEYRRELVIGQAGNESTICGSRGWATGMKGTLEIDAISDIVQYQS